MIAKQIFDIETGKLLVKNHSKKIDLVGRESSLFCFLLLLLVYCFVFLVDFSL